VPQGAAQALARADRVRELIKVDAAHPLDALLSAAEVVAG
jgi:hypothetical protein